MKNIFKSLVAFFAMLLFAGSSANAQKLAYIDLQELVQLMPEYKKANTDLETFYKTLEDELKKMQDEFDKKYKDYLAKEKTLPDAVKEIKQKELQDMQARIQDFQQSAQENYRKKETELMKPIIEKAKAAIGQVAKTGGYTYVFDSSASGLLYKPDGDNLLPAVKKQLGIVQ